MVINYNIRAGAISYPFLRKDATFCCGALPDGVATADRVGEVRGSATGPQFRWPANSVTDELRTAGLQSGRPLNPNGPVRCTSS